MPWKSDFPALTSVSAAVWLLSLRNHPVASDTDTSTPYDTLFDLWPPWMSYSQCQWVSRPSTRAWLRGTENSRPSTL